MTLTFLIFHFLFQLLQGQNTTDSPHSKLYQFPVKTRLARVNKVINLKNSHSVEYLITIKLGSNHTEFDVLLDTNSADFWIPSHNCKGCKQKKRFHCGLSTTCFTDFSEPVKGVYADGPVEGFVAYDQISLDPDIHLPRQSFLLISSCSGSLSDLNGVFGLGNSLPGLNANPSVMDNLLSSGQISSPLFSLFLNTGYDKQKSRLILGVIETSLIKDNVALYWMTFSDPALIKVKYGGIRLNSMDVQVWPGDAVIDSGNTCITLPRKMITQISALLRTNFNISCHFYVETYAPNFSMMDCLVDERKSKDFPVISFNIEGGLFRLEPKDYIYECVKVKKNRTVKCFTKLELSEKNEFLVLGMAFYSSFFIVFNMKEKKLGIAPSVADNRIKVFNSNYKSLGLAKSMSEVYQILYNVPKNALVQDTKSQEVALITHENEEETGFSAYHIVVLVIALPIGICVIFMGIVLYKIISKNISQQPIEAAAS